MVKKIFVGFLQRGSSRIVMAALLASVVFYLLHVFAVDGSTFKEIFQRGYVFFTIPLVLVILFYWALTQYFYRRYVTARTLRNYEQGATVLRASNGEYVLHDIFVREKGCRYYAVDLSTSRPLDFHLLLTTKNGDIKCSVRILYGVFEDWVPAEVYRNLVETNLRSVEKALGAQFLNKFKDKKIMEKFKELSESNEVNPLHAFLGNVATSAVNTVFSNIIFRGLFLETNQS